MLIWLNDSVLDNGTVSDEARSVAFEFFGSLIREGKHILAGNRSTLKRMSMSTDISAVSKALLSRRAEEVSQLGALRRALEVWIEVDGSIDAVLEEQPVDGRMKIVVPLKYFSDSEIIQKTYLLAENDLDCKLLKRIGVTFRSNSSEFRHLRVHFDFRGGGGSTMHAHVETVSQTNRLCLAVADSDRLTKGGRLGGTASSLRTVESSPMLGLYILRSRELENLMPVFLLQKLKDSDGQPVEGEVDFFCALEASQHEWVLRHADLKQGTSIRSVRRLSGNELRDWEDAFDDLVFMLRSNHLQVPSCDLSGEMCSPDCRCILVPGLGDGFLRRCLDVFAGMSHKEVDDNLGSCRSEWAEIGKTVLAWGCAYDVRLVV